MQAKVWLLDEQTVLMYWAGLPLGLCVQLMKEVLIHAFRAISEVDVYVCLLNKNWFSGPP